MVDAGYIMHEQFNVTNSFVTISLFNLALIVKLH